MIQAARIPIQFNISTERNLHYSFQTLRWWKFVPTNWAGHDPRVVQAERVDKVGGCYVQYTLNGHGLPNRSIPISIIQLPNFLAHNRLYGSQIIYSLSAYSLKHIFSNKKGLLDWCYHVPTSKGINCDSLLCSAGIAQPADARQLMVINSCYNVN